MVLCLEATSIDRGGCYNEFSQYPGEPEYLFPPMVFVEPTGLRRLVENKYGGLLWIIDVRVSTNPKSLTVEELAGKKKENTLMCRLTDQELFWDTRGVMHITTEAIFLLSKSFHRDSI